MAANRGKLIAVIGDESYELPDGQVITIGKNASAARRRCSNHSSSDTCVGFLLAGIGEVNEKRQKNFMVVNKDTTTSEIEETFSRMLNRTDIVIILITQKVAEDIRHLIDKHIKPVPAVLEIPSKESPYDSSKDSILKRARVQELNRMGTSAKAPISDDQFHWVILREKTYLYSEITSDLSSVLIKFRKTCSTKDLPQSQKTKEEHRHGGPVPSMGVKEISY